MFKGKLENSDSRTFVSQGTSTKYSVHHEASYSAGRHTDFRHAAGWLNYYNDNQFIPIHYDL